MRERMMQAMTRIVLRVRRGRGTSADALLSLLPPAALLPLRRTALDPVPELGALRAREPVSELALPFGIRGWLVTGYDESRTVLSSADGFSNDFSHLVGKVGITAEQDPGGLGFTDPPHHTRLRKILTPEFTSHRLRRLGPRIEGFVTGQLDEMAAVAARDGHVDLVQHFALPIPSLTICELLGVPYEDRADFQRLSTSRFDFLGGIEGSLGAISESMSYLAELVKHERAEPGDGLLGMIVKEHGDAVTDRELTGLADGLLTGGLETTASMLALGAIVLLRDADVRAALVAPNADVDVVVDELLRYLSVVQAAFPRIAKQDVVVGGQQLKAGDLVFCSLSAANRAGDPDLERVDPSRSTRPHLAFGYGFHRCVGAELARMELRAAYPALLRRFPDVAAAADLDTLEYRKLSFVFGVESLPVTL